MNHIFLKSVSGPVLMMIGVSLPAHANLLADGDFSNPSGGASYTDFASGSSFGPWVVTTGTVDLIGGTYWQPPSAGGGSVDLDGISSGGIAQAFATTPGQTYNVSFDLSGNPDGAPATKSLTVTAGNASPSYTYTTSSNTHANMEYVLESFSFTASGSNTTLSFTSNDPSSGYGAVIGNVIVTAASAVPEPASIALLTVGLLGLGLLRIRPSA